MDVGYTNFPGREKHLCVVTKYAGRSLEWIRGNRSADLTEDAVRRIYIGVLKTLDILHNKYGILHTDISRGNICIPEVNGNFDFDHPVLIDFDQAVLGPSYYDADDNYWGSRYFMSPEQASLGRIVPQTDLWGLGATMYYALFGFRDFPFGIYENIDAWDAFERIRNGQLRFGQFDPNKSAVGRAMLGALGSKVTGERTASAADTLKIWGVEWSPAPPAGNGPALFVDAKGDVRELNKEEHDAIHTALRSLIKDFNMPPSREPNEDGIQKLRKCEVKRLCGQTHMAAGNTRGPPILVYVIDDASLEHALPEGSKDIAKGLITHAGTWRTDPKGQPHANLFIPRSVYNALLALPQDSKELDFWRKHEVGHLLERDADITPDAVESAAAMKLWEAAWEANYKFRYNESNENGYEGCEYGTILFYEVIRELGAKFLPVVYDVRIGTRAADFIKFVKKSGFSDTISPDEIKKLYLGLLPEVTMVRGVLLTDEEFRKIWDGGQDLLCASLRVDPGRNFETLLREMGLYDISATRSSTIGYDPRNDALISAAISQSGEIPPTVIEASLERDLLNDKRLPAGHKLYVFFARVPMSALIPMEWADDWVGGLRALWGMNTLSLGETRYDIYFQRNEYFILDRICRKNIVSYKVFEAEDLPAVLTNLSRTTREAYEAALNDFKQGDIYKKVLRIAGEIKEWEVFCDWAAGNASAGLKLYVDVLKNRSIVSIKTALRKLDSLDKPAQPTTSLIPDEHHPLVRDLFHLYESTKYEIERLQKESSYPPPQAASSTEKAACEGSPADCLTAIKNDPVLFAGMVDKSGGVKISEVARSRPFHPRTVCKEFEILKDLGIFVSVEGKRGYYRFSDMMVGPDENYTKTMINVVNDIRYQVGKKGEARPLHRGNIPNDKISSVRELVKMSIFHQMNLMQDPAIPKGKVLWHILEEGVVSEAQR